MPLTRRDELLSTRKVPRDDWQRTEMPISLKMKLELIVKKRSLLWKSLMKPLGDAQPAVQIVIRVARSEQAQLSRHRICFHKVGKVLKVAGRFFDGGGFVADPERALFQINVVASGVCGGMRL